MRFFIFTFLAISTLLGSDVVLQINSKYHTKSIKKILPLKGGGFLTLSRDKTIRIWDEDFTFKRMLVGQIGSGWSGSYNYGAYNGEDLLAVAGEYAEQQENMQMYKTRIFNTDTGLLEALLETTKGLVRSLHFSEDKKYLIVGYAYPRYTLSVFDTSSWKEVETFRFNRPPRYGEKYLSITHLDAFRDADGLNIVAVSDDGHLDIISLTQKKITASKHLDVPINGLIVTKTFIYIASDKALLQYDLQLNKQSEVALKAPALHLRISPDKSTLLECSMRSCELYNSADLSLQKHFYSFNNTLMDVAFKDDLSIYVSAGHQSGVGLFDIASKKPIHSMRSDLKRVYAVGAAGSVLGMSNRYYAKKNRVDKKLHTYFDLDTLSIVNTKKKSFKESLPTHYKGYSVTKAEGSPLRQGNPTRLSVTTPKGEKVVIQRGSGDGFVHVVYGFSDNGLLISGGAYGFLTAYNPDTGEKVARFMGHNGFISGLVQEKDHLISSSYDGTIRIWPLDDFKPQKVISEITIEHLIAQYRYPRETLIKNADKLKAKYNIDIYEYAPGIVNPLVSLYIGEDDEFVIWTPEGYFSVSSQRALHYIVWHMNKGFAKAAERYDLSKFYDLFFRPDLVQLKLSGQDIQPYTDNMTVETALQNPPPSVSFAQDHIETDKDKIDLSFSISDAGGGVGLIRIYQEGKLIQVLGDGQINKSFADADIRNAEQVYEKSAKRELLALAKAVKREALTFEERVGEIIPSTQQSRSGDFEVTVHLRKGENRISIEAFNRDNTITSVRADLDIEAKIEKKPSTLYAIVAGVNTFESANVSDLQFAVNDARAIEERLKKSTDGIYEHVEIILLKNAEVTKEKITEAFNKVQREAGLNDTFLFYISTHGISANGKFYLFPSNNTYVKNFIDFETLFDRSTTLRPLQQLFVIDACQSGGAVAMASAVYDSRASILARRSGIHLLSASTSGTSAFEDLKHQHGVFTYKILSGLKMPSNDLNADGYVSIRELSTSIKDEYKLHRSTSQYPVIRNVGRDLLLYNLDISK